MKKIVFVLSSVFLSSCFLSKESRFRGLLPEVKQCIINANKSYENSFDCLKTDSCEISDAIFQRIKEKEETRSVLQELGQLLLDSDDSFERAEAARKGKKAVNKYMDDNDIYGADVNSVMMAQYSASSDIYQRDNPNIASKMKRAKSKLKKAKFKKYSNWTYAQVSDKTFRLEDEIDSLEKSSEYLSELSLRSAIDHYPKNKKCIEWLESDLDNVPYQTVFEKYEILCREESSCFGDGPIGDIVSLGINFD